MDFSLAEDDRLLCDSVDELCARLVRPAALAWDAAGAVSDAALAEVAALGLFGLRAAADEGGAGLSWVATTAVLQRLAAGDAGLSLVVAMHTAAAEIVQAAGGLDADVVSGARRLALADGGSLTGGALGGSCGLVLGAGLAHAIVVGLADGGWAIVEAGAPGVAIERLARPLGARSAAPAVVELTTARAQSLPRRASSAIALLLAAVAVGVHEAALAAAVQYAGQREQFGQPIAGFQAIQWKLADMATTLDASRLLVFAAAAHADAGAAARDVSAARAKAMATTAAARAASEALQIHGGYGYTCEFPVERMLRDAKLLEAADGSNRAARARIAGALAPG